MPTSFNHRICLPKRHNAACKIAPVPPKVCITALHTGCKQELQETDAKRQWAHIPVIDLVFEHVMHGSNARNLKDMLSASAVCKSWRAAGQATFFSNSWQQRSAVITHPCQLYTLCPLPHARGGHIRCFVIRECITNSITGKTYKYTLYQGNDYNNRASAKFLLAAVQEKGKRKFAIYMTFNCTGRPVAQLSGNVMGTSYALVSNVSTSSSSSSRNKDALQVAYKLRVRGMMLPRRMSVSLPLPQQHQQQHYLGTDIARSSRSNADCEITVAGDDSDKISQRYDQHHNSNSSRTNSTLKTAAGCRNAGSSSSCQQRQQWQAMHYLQNKAPHWNEGLRCWCLNFRGRVKLASVKNFQLIRDPNAPQQQLLRANSNSSSEGMSRSSSSSSSYASLSTAGSNDIASVSSSSTVSTMSESLHDQQHMGPLADYNAAAAATVQGSPQTYGIVTQFGKVESNTFILDYDPVLVTAVQAFAVALTTFGAKILL